LTENPDGAWTARQARNLVFSLPERDRPLKFLVRDNDGRFTRAFDTVFNSEGVRVIHTPVRAPNANATCERFVGTLRRECLDWILIANPRHLRRVLAEFVDHYNTHRPHRALGLAGPEPCPPTRPVPTSRAESIRRQHGFRRRRCTPRSNKGTPQGTEWAISKEADGTYGCTVARWDRPDWYTDSLRDAQQLCDELDQRRPFLPEQGIIEWVPTTD
jgi:hypothetical protein